MKKCNKCGQQNSEDSLFCEDCGNNLLEQQTNNVEVDENVCYSCGLENDKNSAFCIKCGANLREKNTQKNTTDYKANAMKIGNDAVKVGSDIFNKVKSKVKADKKLAGIVAVLVVVAALIFSGVFISPEKKVLLGLSKIMGNENNEATMTFSVNSETGVDEIDDILKNTEVQLSYYTDLENSEFKVEGSLLLNRKSLLDLNLAAQEEAVYVELPGIYDDYFYVETDEEYAQMIEEYMQFIGYLKEVDLEALTKGKYRDVLIDELSDLTHKKGGKIVVDISTVDALKIVGKICSLAKNDKELAGDLYDSLQEINSKMKKDRFSPESYEIEDIVETIDELLSEYSKKEFVDNILDTLDNMQDSIKDSIEYADDVYLKFTFNMGMFNKIKSVTTTIEVEGIEVAMEADLTKGADKPKYSTKKGVDIINISDSKAEKIGEEIITNLTERVLDNKDVKNLIEETGILYELGYDSVDEFLEDIMDEYIDSL